MSKHTPGPWWVSNLHVRSKDRRHVASCYALDDTTEDDKENKAKQMLIS